MVHAIYPHSHTPWKDPFTERTANGLFTAPWMETPSDKGIAVIQHLSETLTQAHPDDLTLVLGHLLAVHGHCQQAARAREPRRCRQHYQEALQECEVVLFTLQNSQHSTRLALAAWAHGVHTLIRAQIAMSTDPAAAKVLGYEALNQLSEAKDPLCAGAEADSLSAMLLIREPIELAGRLTDLPDRVRAMVDEAEISIHQKEQELAEALAHVQTEHQRAIRWTIGWGALNLGLMATGPINSFYEPQLPWSLPFVIGLAILWYATWARPFRDGLPVFAYLKARRLESLVAFKEAVGTLPAPRPDLMSKIQQLLEAGHHDHERLSRFHLFQIPAECDTCWKARAIVAGAAERLNGEWVASRRDGAPWLLSDLLPADPSLIPGVTRIWFGKLAS